MKRFILLGLLFATGCAGKQNVCPPPCVEQPIYLPPKKIEPLHPPPILFPQETIVPPMKSKVEKCFKFIVSENYPYAEGPDLRWEMSWKW